MANPEDPPLTALVAAQQAYEDAYTAWQQGEERTRVASLALVKLTAQTAYPTATRVEVGWDGDSDGNWLYFGGLTLADGTSVATDEMDDQLNDDLSVLVRDMETHWIDTGRNGDGALDIAADPPVSATL